MPPHVRILARLGNLAVGLFGFLLLLAGFDRVGTPALIIGLAMIAAAGYNQYAIEKAARLLSEEEWLKAQIRKEELRHRLAEMRSQAPSDAAGPPAAEPPPIGESRP